MKNTKDKKSILRTLMRVSWLLIFFVAVMLVAFIGVMPNRISYNVGDIADENIIAPKRIVDADKTEALRAQAENTTAPVYDYLPSAQEETKASAGRLFDAVFTMYPEYIDDSAVSTANALYGTNLNLDQFLLLSRLGESELTQLKTFALTTVDSIYHSGDIKASEIADVRAKLPQYITENSAFGEEENDIIISVIDSLLLPNMILNEDATAIARQSARGSVYEVVYEAGQTIINKGEIITAEDIVLLKKNGLMRTGIFEYMSTSLGLPALIIIITAVFISYMKQFQPRRFEEDRSMLIISLLMLVVLILCQLSSYFSVYLMPISIFTMSICLIFDAKSAVQYNLFFILFTAITLQLDIDALIYLAVSSYVGIIYLKTVRSRTDIFKSGVLVSIVNIAVVLVIGILRNNFGINTLKDIIFAFGSGIFASLLTNGFMLLWESVFNIITPFKLLEMSGTNDAVIQKLISEAPGTYNHSLIVSNLAETACAKIGANSLLARVGSYYHDIGKAEKAIYFKENQTDGDNPHDYVSAEASAKIIKNHVTDGIFLAQKYHIPKEVTDFIATHHGTSEITYFKNKAAEEGYTGDENFRYSGELPRSVETTVVMLADSAEAAVRSLDKRDEPNIKRMIEKIVQKKFDEGQMLKSKLSFDELETVKKVFLEVLCGVYHSRIKYQDQIEELSAEEQND